MSTCYDYSVNYENCFWNGVISDLGFSFGYCVIDFQKVIMITTVLSMGIWSTIYSSNRHSYLSCFDFNASVGVNGHHHLTDCYYYSGYLEGNNWTSIHFIPKLNNRRVLTTSDVAFELIEFRGENVNDYYTSRDVALKRASVGSRVRFAKGNSCVIGGNNCRVYLGSACCHVCHGHDHSRAYGYGSCYHCYDGSLHLSDCPGHSVDG